MSHAETVPEISVVVPLYCEAGNVPALAQSVAASIETTGADYELILIDDGSLDHTWDAVLEQARNDRRIVGLKLSRNFGKESALCAGLEAARGRAVVTMDGDLQHPPDALPAMIGMWRAQEAKIVEVVKADRRGQSWWGRFTARLFYLLLKLFSGAKLDRLSDFKLLDRQVVAAWLSMKERNLFYRGMVWWLGFSRAQIEAEVPLRAGGRSKWSFFSLFRLAGTAITAFSSAPLHIASLVGISFLAFALALGAHTVYMKLTGQAVSGFTTVILLQLIIGSLVLSCMGVIGAYVARIYDEVKGRPRYVVADRSDDMRPDRDDAGA